MVSGGVSSGIDGKEAPFPFLAKRAYIYAFESLGIDMYKSAELIDGAVMSYSHETDDTPEETDQALTVMDSLCLSSKPLVRINEDAGGGLCFQEAARHILTESMDICLACGWEARFQQTHISGNALVPPVSAAATSEQMAKVCVKNHRNAAHNPYAPHEIHLTDGRVISAQDITIDQVQEHALHFRPCDRANGAAVCILASKEGLHRLHKAGVRLRHAVIISGMGRAQAPSPAHTDHAHSSPRHPSITRTAAHQAYEAYGFHINYPRWELDFLELHDPFAAYEIRAYENMGLCARGEGGRFIDNGLPFLKTVDYGNTFREFSKRHPMAVNPSGGLTACGHAGAATGLRQTVFTLWQIQHTIKQHFGSDALQIPGARRGAIHSRAANGTVSVSILER